MGQDGVNGEAELTLAVTVGDYRRTERMTQKVVWGPPSEARIGFETVLQHDNVLKPELCGGPFIDFEGRAIGLNIACDGRVEALALPASDVYRIVARRFAGSKDANPVRQQR